MIVPTISVIVPVYNTAKYLHRCIDSVLAQTFTDFELLLIDDGSKDNSGAICDEYAKKDSRVRVFHKKNGGVTSARSFGVNNAIGAWITFVDADDELKIKSLQLLVENLTKECDIIIGFLDIVNINEDLYDIENYRKDCIAGVRISPCGKLYKRTLFNSWIFDIPSEIKCGEDWIMNVRLSFSTNKSVKRLLYPNNVVYIYHENEQQTTKKLKRCINADELFIKHLLLSIPDRVRDLYLHSICLARMYCCSLLVIQDYRFSVQKTDNYKCLLLDSFRVFDIKKILKVLSFSNHITRFLFYRLRGNKVL